MEGFIQTITSFFIVMGIVFTSLIIVAFVLKLRGLSFVEFFPKNNNLEAQTPNIVYSTTNPNIVSSSIEPKKVAAIIAAIEHHNKT